MSGLLRYHSNNSGGSWWLSDEDWQKLEEAGWVVHWVHDANDPSHTHTEASSLSHGPHYHSWNDVTVPARPSGARWLGALATSAVIATDDPEKAIARWELIVGQSSTDEGCNCCGPPHEFEYRDANGNTKHSEVVVTKTERRWW